MPDMQIALAEKLAKDEKQKAYYFAQGWLASHRHMLGQYCDMELIVQHNALANDFALFYAEVVLSYYLGMSPSLPSGFAMEFVQFLADDVAFDGPVTDNS
jgi:hypothetical protein